MRITTAERVEDRGGSLPGVSRQSGCLVEPLVTFPTITFRDDGVGFAELDNSKRHGIGGEAAVIVTSAGCGVFGADSQNLGISATQQFGTKLRDQSRMLVFSAC